MVYDKPTVVDGGAAILSLALAVGWSWVRVGDQSRKKLIKLVSFRVTSAGWPSGKQPYLDRAEGKGSWMG